MFLFQFFGNYELSCVFVPGSFAMAHIFHRLNIYYIVLVLDDYYGNDNNHNNHNYNLYVIKDNFLYK